MSLVNRNYIISERFIHDELLRRAEAAVAQLTTLWKKHRLIEASILIWPADTVRTDDGQPHEGLIYGELPPETERPAYLKKVAERWKPYALLVIEQKGSLVKAIFESPHGTRTWTMSIAKHGDVRVLGTAKIQDDVESLGLLWSPKQGRS